MKTNSLAMRTERLQSVCKLYTYSSERLDLSPILEVLPHIHLEDGYRLEGLASHVASDSEFSLPLGSETIVYSWKNFPPPSENLIRDHHLRRQNEYVPEYHLYVENNPEGIWEFFLFTELRCFLPLHWHALRSRIKIITNADSLMGIVHIPTKTSAKFGWLRRIFSSNDKGSEEYKKIAESVAALNGDESLLPSVDLDGETARLTYTFWSDWQGLVREHVEIVNSSGHAYIKNRESEQLVHCDCGIMF